MDQRQIIDQKSIDTAKRYLTLLNAYNIHPFVFMEALDENPENGELQTKMLYITGRSNNDLFGDIQAFIASSNGFGHQYVRMTSDSFLINDAEEKSFRHGKNRFAGVSDPSMFIHTLDLESKHADVLALPYQIEGGAINWLEPSYGTDDIVGNAEGFKTAFDSEIYQSILHFIEQFFDLSEPENHESIMTPTTMMSIIMANESSKSRKSILLYGPSPDEDIMNAFAMPERVQHEKKDGFSFYHFSFGDILESSKKLRKILFEPMLKS